MTRAHRVTAAIALVPASALLTWLAAATAGAAAASLTALSCLLAAGFALLVGPTAPPRIAGLLAAVGPAAGLAALIVYLGYNAGGFYPATDAFVAVLLAVALCARIALVERPFAGVNWWVATAVVALALFALWALVSGTWSGAPSRALVGFDRALLYTEALLFFGCLPRTPGRLRRLLRGLAAGATAVCLGGLLTRTLPDVFPTIANTGSATAAFARLSFPVTYWNALGLLAAIGVIASLHLSANAREPLAVRAAGAAAVAPLAVTLLLTFSRGAIVAGAVGVLAFVVLVRSRVLPSALLAIVPTTAIAVAVAYGADLLASPDPASPAAARQGHAVAWTVLACAGAAAGLRAALSPLDRYTSGLSVPLRLRRPLTLIAAVGAVLAGGLALAAAAPGVGEQVDRFVNGTAFKAGRADSRQRLTNPGGKDRLDHWRISVRQYEAAPVLGQGSETFELAWNRQRPTPAHVLDAHSLYLEVLGELGAVGLGLLLVCLGAIVVRVASLARVPRRVTHGAVLAAALAWGVHAAVDWDWEMPAVTIWLFVVGGCAMASGPRHMNALRPPGRLIAALAAVALGLPSALIAVSQSRLESSTTAFARGDCAAADERAQAALSTVDVWPRAYETTGYCRLGNGRGSEAVAAMRAARDRDPEHWRYRYGLAVALAAAGRDPRPEAAAAARLSPREPFLLMTPRLFRGQDPEGWRRQARRAAVPADPNS